MRKLIKVLLIPVNMAIAPLASLGMDIAFIFWPIPVLEKSIEFLQKELDKEKGLV